MKELLSLPLIFEVCLFFQLNPPKFWLHRSFSDTVSAFAVLLPNVSDGLRAGWSITVSRGAATWAKVLPVRLGPVVCTTATLVIVSLTANSAEVWPHHAKYPGP